MLLRNPGDYIVDLEVMMPVGRYQLKCVKSARVDMVRNCCSSTIPADADNITLQVDDRELADNKRLSQFANGTVITCTVDRNVPV